jgi:hypothetical protein
MASWRTPCLKCGKDIPIEFVRGPQKGLCRKCRRLEALKEATAQWKARRAKRSGRNLS